MVDFDEEVDVLVAGSGGGLAGAYTAAREGLSVAVVEATDKFGGTTAYSGAAAPWVSAWPSSRHSSRAAPRSRYSIRPRIGFGPRPHG